jgi:hypothetical protein
VIRPTLTAAAVTSFLVGGSLRALVVSLAQPEGPYPCEIILLFTHPPGVDGGGILGLLARSFLWGRRLFGEGAPSPSGWAGGSSGEPRLPVPNVHRFSKQLTPESEHPLKRSPFMVLSWIETLPVTGERESSTTRTPWSRLLPKVLL